MNVLVSAHRVWLARVQAPPVEYDPWANVYKWVSLDEDGEHRTYWRYGEP